MKRRKILMKCLVPSLVCLCFTPLLTLVVQCWTLQAAEPGPQGNESLRLGTPKMMANGSVELVVRGTIFRPLAGYRYTLEASTDLKLWNRLQTKSALSNEVTFVDSTASSHPRRFSPRSANALLELRLADVGYL